MELELNVVMNRLFGIPRTGGYFGSDCRFWRIDRGAECGCGEGTGPDLVHARETEILSL